MWVDEATHNKFTSRMEKILNIKKLDGLREQTGQMQIIDRNRSSNLILSSL